MKPRQTGRIDLTLPHWLSPGYRRSLLHDSAACLVRAARSLNDGDSAAEMLVTSLRLLRRFATRSVQCRHVLKHEAVWQALRENPPEVIVEVGSFDGIDAIELSRMFPDAWVYTFEADPRNYDILRRNTSYRTHVRPVPKAVFDFTGDGVFHASDSVGSVANGRASGSMLTPTQRFHDAHSDVRFEEKFSVSTVALADWAREERIGKVDFLWMDAQGAELHILRGMGEDLLGVRAILLEVWKEAFYAGGGALDEIETFLGKYGFELTHTWIESGVGDALFQRR
jgi:FkbM family methyltransferase